mmetsp:Transcript_37799/g.117510  ORF Transcript_37799/g.117510 Transcript_37799/m.117510 type:complete len:231 (-) Transcript_37799:444-1136(-)
MPSAEGRRLAQLAARAAGRRRGCWGQAGGRPLPPLPRPLSRSSGSGWSGLRAGCRERRHCWWPSARTSGTQGFGRALGSAASALSRPAAQTGSGSIRASAGPSGTFAATRRGLARWRRPCAASATLRGARGPALASSPPPGRGPGRPRVGRASSSSSTAPCTGGSARSRIPAAWTSGGRSARMRRARGRARAPRWTAAARRAPGAGRRPGRTCGCTAGTTPSRSGGSGRR